MVKIYLQKFNFILYIHYNVYKIPFPSHTAYALF